MGAKNSTGHTQREWEREKGERGESQQKRSSSILGRLCRTNLCHACINIQVFIVRYLCQAEKCARSSRTEVRVEWRREREAGKEEVVREWNCQSGSPTSAHNCDPKDLLWWFICPLYYLFLPHTHCIRFYTPSAFFSFYTFLFLLTSLSPSLCVCPSISLACSQLIYLFIF